jgi:hypothetical protein
MSGLIECLDGVILELSQGNKTSASSSNISDQELPVAGGRLSRLFRRASADVFSSVRASRKKFIINALEKIKKQVLAVGFESKTPEQVRQFYDNVLLKVACAEIGSFFTVTIGLLSTRYVPITLDLNELRKKIAVFFVDQKLQLAIKKRKMVASIIADLQYCCDVLQELQIEDKEHSFRNGKASEKIKLMANALYDELIVKAETTGLFAEQRNAVVFLQNPPSLFQTLFSLRQVNKKKITRLQAKLRTSSEGNLVKLRQDNQSHLKRAFSTPKLSELSGSKKRGGGSNVQMRRRVYSNAVKKGSSSNVLRVISLKKNAGQQYKKKNSVSKSDTVPEKKQLIICLSIKNAESFFSTTDDRKNEAVAKKLLNKTDMSKYDTVYICYSKDEETLFWTGKCSQSFLSAFCENIASRVRDRYQDKKGFSVSCHRVHFATNAAVLLLKTNILFVCKAVDFFKSETKNQAVNIVFVSDSQNDIMRLDYIESELKKNQIDWLPGESVIGIESFLLNRKKDGISMDYFFSLSSNKDQRYQIKKNAWLSIRQPKKRVKNDSGVSQQVKNIVQTLVNDKKKYCISSFQNRGGSQKTKHKFFESREPQQNGGRSKDRKGKGKRAFHNFSSF